MSRPGVLAFILLIAAGAGAKAAVTVSPRADGIDIRNGAVLERIVALRDDIVRIRVGPEGRLPEDASWAVLPTSRHSRASVRRFAEPGVAGFSTAAVTVRVALTDGRLRITDPVGRTILADAPDRPLTLDPHGFAVRQTLAAGEHIFGLGDKTGPLDRRGQAFSMWNTDAFGWQESTDPLYKSVPFFIGVDDSGRAFGLFLDNTWRSWFDFGRTDPRILSFGAEAGPLDYYVIAGPAPKQVVEAWAWLTGPSPMPPRWALGFQQSRYSYMNDTEVRGIAHRLRRERIPADAIYLDIDYQDRNRPFTVNTEAFPDLARLATDLKAEGLRLVLITDLHIADLPGQGYAPYDTGEAGDDFVKTPDGKPYVGIVWPGRSVFPDFTRAATRLWWGGLYKTFHDDGIAGFWNDMNEPAVFDGPGHSMPLDIVHRIDEPGFVTRTASHAEVHNIYGMENSRATYEGLLRLDPDERPFVLTRASFAGGQRYAWTWTGDNDATWNHLRISVGQLENLGLSGFAWSGADVGGFAGSPSPELLTRWIEVAAFTPLFRDHSGKGTARHEPWVDGEAQTDIRRRFIEARYQLLPYFYALADETARTGLPIMRPLFLEFPTAAGHLRDTGLEFMFGPDLVVAPQPQPDTRDDYDIVLPGRGWFDYWTGLPVAAADSPPGITRLRETPTLDRLPVYVRPGAILPRQPLVQSTAQTPQGPLEIDVYPGPDCHGVLYWDDGHSRRREQGAVLRQSLACAVLNGRLTVTFDRREGPYPPWWQRLTVVVHGWTRAEARASLAGKAVASAYAAGAQTLTMDLPDQPGPVVLKVE
ncbi:MAG TPA: TIM-barrel domain-containing protein [Caulobacteraceae bacterium]